MNWNIFYTINQGFLDILLGGAIYFVMFSTLLLTIKYLIMNLEEED